MDILVANTVKTPLLRGGAAGSDVAGMCLSAYSLTHSYTPLERGIAQASLLLTLFSHFRSFLPTKHFNKW